MMLDQTRLHAKSLLLSVYCSLCHARLACCGLFMFSVDCDTLYVQCYLLHVV